MLLIILEAKNATLNIVRCYKLTVERNLFGQWHLTIAFGRLNRRLVYKYFIQASEQECLKKAKLYLRKRSTAERRIGCAYRLIRLQNQTPLEDREIVSWLKHPSRSVKDLTKKQSVSVLQRQKKLTSLPSFDAQINV